MSLLTILERKFGRFAIPQLTLILIACQVVVYCVMQGQARIETPEPLFMRLLLIPNRVFEGEVWRLLAFLIIPPADNVVFAFFFWFLFYLMGTALESFWGTFRYNVYLLIGYIATVAVAFITPDLPATNTFLEGSVFLAFAFLCPDFALYIFFIFPVKIKWLALLAWVGYGLVLLFGEWQDRLLVLASVGNFLLFFSRDILDRMQTSRRHMAFQAAHFAAKPRDYFHRCTVCGITDRSHPNAEFRYCSKCAGAHGYCMDHLHKHEHVVEEEKPAEK